ncbi:MAG: 30S ribosomal protein S20 [Sphingomonadales bacterium]|nr:30S ribosomal protein S20 [Sphingomonadales bacterium]
MANSPQAKKRIRSSEARTLVNKNRRSRIRTFVKKVEGALEAGDKSAAEVALKEAQPELQRGVTKGLVHKKTAARKISRLAHQVNKLG